jgi:hypothetical protein
MLPIAMENNIPAEVIAAAEVLWDYHCDRGKAVSVISGNVIFNIYMTTGGPFGAKFLAVYEEYAAEEFRKSQP